MLLALRFTLILTLALCSALCQNAEPNRRFHQLGSSSAASNFHAQRNDFWGSSLPEAGNESSLRSEHGNEKHEKALESASRRQISSSSSSKKKRRQRTKQQRQLSWRGDGGDGGGALRESLLNVGGLTKSEALAPTGFESLLLAKKTRRFREERRRRTRKPISRSQRLGLDSSPVGAVRTKVPKEAQQQSTGLEDNNPLNLSMTRFVEAHEAAKILEPPSWTPAQPSSGTAAGGTLQREFSRQVEGEFVKSAALEQQQQQLAKFDPQRMLAHYSTNAEQDLPVVDLENELLQRTVEDCNAYASSSSSSSSSLRSSLQSSITDPDALQQLRGDLSCVNGTFLPAPVVRHAVIRYLKSSRPGQEYLEADYECESGYVLISSSSSSRLLCRDRGWIGSLPVCKYRSDSEGKKPTCAELACSQLCRIVDGKPECSCREGFRQLGASSCLDVNECEANGGKGPCQDTCRNLEGSFECSCETRPGSQLAGDKRTCVQQLQPTTTTAAAAAGPCSRDSAGCSHSCLASMGRVFCLCPDGFVLEDDWKTCRDVNECVVPDLQTEVCRYGCVNTPGSYRCAPAPIDSLRRRVASKLDAHCQPGYQFHSQAQHCADVDECRTNNGGCSEICQNTHGSFVCACEGDDRTLAADGRSCVEAERRETAAAAARAGLSCSALNPAGRGYLLCSGVEDGEKRIRPGAKCQLKCPHGYELHGEYELTCRADGSWDGPKHGECLRYSKPRLDCPKDVVAELPAGRDEAFVAFEQPSTDLDWFRYVRSKPSWGTRLEANLKLGLHQISFFARHPVSKKQASCTLNISVQEGQAPKVLNCPSDIQVAGENGSAISWTEPIFTDNVKVIRVSSSQSPGQTFSLGGHKVEYEAADEAGWTTKCIFTVVLRPLVP